MVLSQLCHVYQGRQVGALPCEDIVCNYRRFPIARDLDDLSVRFRLGYEASNAVGTTCVEVVVKTLESA